ncbi:MAG: class I SAM-dependent methyltransferase [Chloroflexi bacterium]|nr:class I SAM-dependent methyltransferase [Chloroflexota bacterium]
MMRDPRSIVREGYDAISQAYRSDTFELENSGYQPFVEEFEIYVTDGGRVLDLGCGCGAPVAKRLSKKYQVTGIDVSPVQIARAKRNVPAARFLCGDMTELDFEPASFDAIVSFYAVIHVPLELQPALFQKLARWLTPGGHLMITVGGTEWTGTEPEWHGAEMYWSHADRHVYRRWLEDLGFTILMEHFIPEGKGGHPLFLARGGQS